MSKKIGVGTQAQAGGAMANELQVRYVYVLTWECFSPGYVIRLSGLSSLASLQMHEQFLLELKEILVHR